MESQRAWLWFIAVIVVMVAVYVWWYNSGAPAVMPASSDFPASTTNETDMTASSSAALTTGNLLEAQVAYTDSGFSPAQVSVAVGGTVTFTNQSTGRMWVASDPHPTHEGYSGTTVTQHCPDTAGVAFDECAVGNTYTFTFQKAGTWGYHNHSDSTQYGTVIVTP